MVAWKSNPSVRVHSAIDREISKFLNEVIIYIITYLKRKTDKMCGWFEQEDTP